MKKLLLLLIVAIGLARTACAEETNRSVFPEEFQNAPGNYGSIGFTGPGENQYFYGASLFQNQWKDPVEIYGVAFRGKQGEAVGINSTIPSLGLRLSTSQKSPSTLSGNYQLNKGSDEAVVLSPGEMSFSVPANLPLDQFGIEIPFDHAFVYDSSKGGLLMYLLLGAGEGYGSQALDSNRSPSSQGAAIESRDLLGGSNQLMPNILIAEFQWRSVPEPHSVLLMFLGGAWMLKVSFKRK